MSSSIKFKLNGEDRTVDAETDNKLLYVLRDELGLKGPKFGCGLAQCGACTVHLGGVPIRSCIVPMSAVEGQEVTTLEGLGSTDNPHPLQQAFIDEQAVQCGYCINGMIMQAKGLLDKNPHPSRDEIKQALDNNLCRCATHMRIIRAVERAADLMEAQA